MTFVTAGLAIAGVVGILIPIVIFLLWRQRRTPVPWAAMRFLMEAFRKHRRRLQIEQLLLLAIRCLIIALLGFALARPLLEGSGLLDGGGSRTVYLVVDNGIASGVKVGPETNALDGHVAGALEILDGLDAGDRVGVITAGRPARALLHPPSSDHAAVADLLRGLEPSAAPTDLPGAIDRLRSVLEKLEADHDKVLVYMLSEYRAGSVALDEAPPSALPSSMDASTARVLFRSAPPATSPIGNVQITALQPARSLVLADAIDGSGQVTVRLSRQGGDLEHHVTRVRLVGDGLVPIEPKVIEWAPGQTEARADFVLDVAAQRERETGLHAVIDDDALAADNERATVVALRTQVRVLLIDRRSFGFEPAIDRLTAGQWMRRAIAPRPEGAVDIVEVEPAALDVADLRTSDVAVLPRPDLVADSGWQALRRYVDGGGLLLITPPADLNVHRWTDRLREDLGLRWHLDREASDFPDGIALADEQPPSALLHMISGDLAEMCRPIVTRRALMIDTAQSRVDPILVFADGRPLVIAGAPDQALPGADGASADLGPNDARGMVVYLASAPQLDWTTLPGKPLMVPLLQEVIRQGLSLIRAGSEISVGERPSLLAGAAARSVVTPDGEHIALDRLRRPERALDKSGLYGIVDMAGQEVGAVAVNVNASAARTDVQPAAAVEAWLGRSGPWGYYDPKNVGADLRGAEGGSPLAGLLLLIVLGLVLLETLLARWFSHAYEATGGVDHGLDPTMGPLASKASRAAGIGGRVMNSPIARWLLDLELIPADAADLRLAWEHTWPAWLWTLLVLGALALAFWSYRRLTGRRLVRGALAVVRTAIILLAIAIIAGPMLELPRETIEQDWVLILADRSASMNIADADGTTARISRDEQLRQVIERRDTMWSDLAAERQVKWLGFHAGAFSLVSDDTDDTDAASDAASAAVSARRPALGAATGTRTSLNSALEQALQRAAARPVSGIVVMSDGRTSEPPSRALLRHLQAEAIPVFTVPLGSPEPLGDLALRRVDAPRRAFVRDKVPVVVEIDRFGSAVRELGGVVRLVDDITGETLDREELLAGDDRDRLTLTAEPEFAGEAAWSVVIEMAEPDLVPENNRRPILIELVDRPLRVLYVDGYPRWEYRYLKNLLIRERSIECSVMLLSADRDFAQEGNEPITRLPRSPEELARYDVVVLGDAPANFFSPDQLDMIRNHVAERGAGLLWIGGERYTPESYAGSVLADLLPMRGGLKLPMIDTPVNMRPTELAERLGVLRLVTGAGVGWPRELTDPTYGWSQLYAAQRIERGRLKPTAEVLAETVGAIDGAHLPLVIHIRYGAGQSIYAATDEIWRWRYGRGELLPDQFWIQMIRMLGRASLATSGDRAVLDVSPRRLEVGQPVRIDLRLLDAQLVDPRRQTVRAVLETAEGTKVADLELRRLPDSPDRFAATYLPEATGQLRVRLDDALLNGLALTTPVEVFTPDDELRRPESDHPMLAGLAEATGGRVLLPADIERLPELLPNRAVRTLNPLRERIWDTPLAFVLVLLLLTMEWVGRKVLRLV